MSGVSEYKCPVDGCDYLISAAGPRDPEDPYGDEFAGEIREHQRSHVPVPGDRVLMTDGSTARVAARREVGGGVMLQVQRAGLDYAEWVGVEEIEAHLDDGRVHDPVEAERQAYGENADRAVWAHYKSIRDDIRRQNEARLRSGPSIIRRVLDAVDAQDADPEGEPADVGDTPRPFQVGDEVLVDGEPGVIAEMRDEAVRVDSAHALVEMTGFSFPAWDVVALSADRTRPVDGRRIELVRPASTGRISSQAGLASIRHGVVPMDDAAGVLELAHEVVRAAHRWVATELDVPWVHDDARAALRAAVRAHRAAGGGS